MHQSHDRKGTAHLLDQNQPGFGLIDLMTLDKLTLVGYLPTMVITGNEESGFDSREGVATYGCKAET